MNMKKLVLIIALFLLLIGCKKEPNYCIAPPPSAPWPGVDSTSITTKRVLYEYKCFYGKHIWVWFDRQDSCSPWNNMKENVSLCNN
jgi:hypothetical protein